MRLKSLKLENIRSYNNEELLFPEGSILLCGDIGSGKTSILLALEYALFGLQPGQRGSSLLANGKNTGSVTLEMEVGSQNIIIERKLRRGSKTINQDYAAITIDGHKTESSVTEIKTKILEVLNYPAEFIKKNNLLYRYTVYTPQEEMKQIILEDAESRLNVLRHIFGIDKYKRIKENLAIFTSKLREESRILQSEVRDLGESKNKLESNKKFIELLENKIKLKSESLIEIISKKRSVEEKINTIEQKIREKETFSKEIEKTNLILYNKKEQIANEEKTIKELEKKILSSEELFDEKILQETISQLTDKKNLIEELNKDLIEISGKVSSLDLKKSEDLEKKNRIFKIDICPTCLQDVSETHKHNILNETENQLKNSEKQTGELNKKMSSLKEIISNEKTLLSKLEERKTTLEILKVKTEEIKSANEKIQLIRKSKENAEKDIDFLENHIQTLKQSTLEFTKFDNLLKIEKTNLKKIQEEEKSIEIESAELRKELELTKKEIVEIENKISKTEEINQKLIKILEIEKWLSEDFMNLINFTEKNIMLTLRNEFSKIFNHWFSVLTTDSFYVHLDENFTPIVTQKDFELDYSNLSGGERTAVALAYRLALNQILNSILSQIKTQGLVILDEPTDGFSEAQLDKVRDILQELKTNQLIIVSHEQKIESFVDNIIRLKKENGISNKE